MNGGAGLDNPAPRAIRDRACELHALGFSVIPLAYGDKRPVRGVAWGAFQVRQADELQLAAWFAGELRNLGIVTGVISGVVVVDIDSPEARIWAESHLPATAMRTKTANGEHWFYQHPGGRVPNRARVFGLALDVRGDGGYVVGPGAVHPTGAVYEAIGDWSAVASLPVFDPAWLEDRRPGGVQ